MPYGPVRIRARRLVSTHCLCSEFDGRIELLEHPVGGWAVAAHLNTRQLFRKISNNLLKEMFERAGMRDLPWLTMTESRIEPLIEALDAMEDEARRQFQGSLQDIIELTDDLGAKLLIEELGTAGRRVLEEFAILQSHSDRSAWCFLHRPKEFRRALNFVRADGWRRLQTWIRRDGFPQEPIPNPRKGAKELQERLRTFYWEKEQRGKRCCVEHSRKPSGEDYFFCYIENYPDAGTILDDDDQPVRSTEIRVFDNVFVFHGEHGQLEMYAPGGKPIVEPLQLLFGEAIFGKAIGPADPVRPAYILDHLLNPDRRLRWHSDDPVLEAAITRLRLQPVDRPTEHVELVVDAQAGPGRIDVALAEFLNAERLTSDRVRVKQAAFRLTFGRGSGRGR